MSRFRQIHNIWGVYASEPPATGFCYSNYVDEKHNNSQLGFFDNNLLHQIDRIQNFNYNFSIERDNLKQLGTRGLVGRPIVNRPSIQVNFDYLMVGVRNENRLGFIVNYNDVTGRPILDREICCFSNFTGQDTDYRNLFVAVSPDQEDLANRIKDIENPNADIHPSGLFVFAFGNCYLNSYKINVSVGQFPVASVGYICDNVMAYSSGSGVNIPAVLPKTGTLMPNVNFTIPRNISIPSPSVIRPKDIYLQIFNTGFSDMPLGALFGVSSSGMPIQSFDMSINLERQDLRSVGYVLPIDRRLNFPIMAELNFSSIIGDNYSGNLIDILNKNQDYALLINMYNPSCNSTGKEIAIQYKINNSKFNGATYNYGINNNLIGTFAFSAEIDISTEKGLFISGSLNIPDTDSYLNNFLLLGNNYTGFLFIENNDLLIVSENTIE